MDGKNGEKVYDLHRKKDGIFGKPFMSKAEIAKKVESHASRIENVSSSKQVSKLLDFAPLVLLEIVFWLKLFSTQDECFCDFMCHAD